MLDIRLIREDPQTVKRLLASVGFEAEGVDRILECDASRRRLQHQLDEMRALRTRESKELGKAAPAERDARRAEMRELGERIAAGERELSEIENLCDSLMLEVPNTPRPFVPVGAGESENRIVKTEGELREFSFKPIP